MNIFYFDENVDECARDHCDAHVVKMILESAQILCTVLWMNDIHAPYRSTHNNHPCTVWANQSLSNWNWLKMLAEALNQEYKYRFNHDRNHKSYDVIVTLNPPPIIDLGLTERPQVMPDEYKNKRPEIAYRQYFVARKLHLGSRAK